MAIRCFHNPDEENGYLGNWYPSEFKVDSIKFSSMEQYMMYEKAKVFGDTIVAEKILNTEDVSEIKSLGREVSNYNETYWNGIRQIVVYKGLMEKFLQNKSLKKQLLGTEDDILAECAVHDKIWGIGLSMKDENRFNMDKWRGENMLGFSLMMVRESLKS